MPFPFKHQIDLDIPRTYPEDEFFTKDSTKVQLSKILTAYSRRCVKIGYCQGFNFIVGKILKICKNDVRKIVCNLFPSLIGRNILDIRPNNRKNTTGKLLHKFMWTIS